MPDNVLRIDVSGWVESVKADPVAYRQRQAVEIVLNAVAALNPTYRLYLKGGLLMGLVYKSTRLTTDIDLTAGFAPSRGIGDKFAVALGKTLPSVAARLGYVGMDVRVHSAKERPRNFSKAKFPGLKIKIKYTFKASERPGKLSEDYFDVDVSFREQLRHIDILQIADDQTLYAYGLIDLVSEKYRAVFQQIPRQRNRRQDIYDLWYLIAAVLKDDSLNGKILETIQEKCQSRHIEVDRKSLDDPEIRRRSETDWETLAQELDTLPEFDSCFARAKEFYKNLPWDKT